ncbi:hypothetical protein DPMN_136290 [Dreissena polymorpha]|uniref:Uncharacterized protein n=1 Tax=Dreissena polymorpha TaxID=45954 RepID=A0A9D4G0L6_DREPO|nr:hypothetical protein DPMN_136290 [Dreissena polymorpha]
MEKNKAAASLRRHPSETLAINRTDPSKAFIQYDMTIYHKEPPIERKRGRHRNTWRRYMDADAEQMGKTWGQLERLAQNETPGGSWLAQTEPLGKMTC